MPAPPVPINKKPTISCLPCPAHRCYLPITTPTPQGASVPPWRRYDAMLARWLPKAFDDEEITQQHMAAAAQGSWPASARATSSSSSSGSASFAPGSDYSFGSSASSSFESNGGGSPAAGVGASAQQQPRVVYGFDVPAKQQQHQQQVEPSAAGAGSPSSVAADADAVAPNTPAAAVAALPASAAAAPPAPGSGSFASAPLSELAADEASDLAEADDSTDEPEPEHMPAALALKAAATAATATAAAAAGPEAVAEDSREESVSAPAGVGASAALSALGHAASGSGDGVGVEAAPDAVGVPTASARLAAAASATAAAVAAAARQADSWVESYRRVTKPVNVSSSSHGGSSVAAAGAAAAAAGSNLGGALQTALPVGSIHSVAAVTAGGGYAAPSEVDGGVAGGAADQWVCWGLQVAAVAEQVGTVSNAANNDTTCHGGSDSGRLGGACMAAVSARSSSRAGLAPAAAAVKQRSAPLLRFPSAGRVLKRGELPGMSAAGVNGALKAGSSGSNNTSSRICVVKLSGAAAAAAVKAQKQHQAVAGLRAVAAGVQASSSHVSASGAAVPAAAPGVSNAELQAAFVSDLRMRLCGWDVGVEERMPQGGGVQRSICAVGDRGCGGGGGSSGGVASKSLGGLRVVSGGLAPGWGASKVCHKLLSSSGMPWPLGFA